MKEENPRRGSEAMGRSFLDLEINRREFLSAAARMGMAAAAGATLPLGWPASAAAQLPAPDAAYPGKEKLIVRSLKYLDLEMPVHLVDSWITPVDLFYVRNHLQQPRVNPAEWSVTVTGEVERPLELSLGELNKMEAGAVTTVLECAGNGRAYFRPRVPGIQWRRGAVGNASFSGARLAAVLRRAGLKSTAKHVAFNGLDRGAGKTPDFIRSIPMEKALNADTLLATEMNGARLTVEHGAPVRVVVPGWLGAASVKWLIEIHVLENEFDGNFQKPGYRMPKHPVEPGGDVKPEDTETITALDVKSIIARPGDGATLKRGPARITGATWAGEEEVTRVEVSTDGGQTWREAALGRDRAKYAWRLWEYVWTPPPGTHVLMSRATDSAGRRQPMTVPWNPAGYLWNAADQVRIHVEA